MEGLFYGLLDYWITGLLDYWITGLLDYIWAAIKRWLSWYIANK
jgi:hypothetical protein